MKFKKNKNLKFLMFLALIIISGCGEDPYYDVSLGVPFCPQIAPNSCGAACVQMWAEYKGNYVTQLQIQQYMGILGASPSYIAEAVCWFCYLFAVPDAHDVQDHSISDQLCSMSYYETCIPIINNGFHAVILNKAGWHRECGVPYMDYVCFHDPNYYNPYPNVYASIATWKFIYESCWNTGDCYITVIDIIYAHSSEAANGYNGFRAQGGTYYGENPDDGNEYIQY